MIISESALTRLADDANRLARSAGCNDRLTLNDAERLLSASGYSCAWCGRRAVLHVQHVFPLQPGRVGRNRMSNTRLVCEGCLRRCKH